MKYTLFTQLYRFSIGTMYSIVLDSVVLLAEQSCHCLVVIIMRQSICGSGFIRGRGLSFLHKNELLGNAIQMKDNFLCSIYLHVDVNENLSGSLDLNMDMDQY
jgi:hypothetical protein